MICPGVISMGMPRPGVEGRGGDAGRVLRSEGKEANDTGEVGRDTVMGMEFAAPVRVKPLLVAIDMLGCVLVKLLVETTMGRTATMRLPSLLETTTSLCTVPPCPAIIRPRVLPVGTTILWVTVPVFGTNLTLVTPTGAGLGVCVCRGSSDG